jgi:V/A-type H+-transporting ATPase subunit D
VTPGGAPPPTRHNLLRARKRLERVAKGADLLTRKRRALVGELFDLAAPAVDAREEVLRRAETAYPALLSALGCHGAAELRALGWPTRGIEVETRTARIWGIGVAEIVRRTPVRRSLTSRGTPPGATGPSAIQAADEFEELVELLLDAASREALIRRLGDALARTSRQLNTLERRIGPELQRRIGATRRVLEEREREEQVRGRLLVRRLPPTTAG